MKAAHALALCAALFALSACASHPRGSNALRPAPSGKAKASSLAAASDGKQVADIAGDSGTDAWDEEADVKVLDPLRPMNRAVFSFNHGVYTVVAKPLSKAYTTVVPELVRRGVRNVYANVRFPVRFVNHLLQGRFDRAAKETGKFVVNSTAGVAGIMTPSDKIPALAELPPADTGQTFGKWGIPHGPYLVLPVLGPSSTRDAAGLLGDTVLNPVSWVGIVFGGAVWTTAVSAPYGAHSVPDQMDKYDAVTKDALDRYLAARTAYIQNRNAAIKR